MPFGNPAEGDDDTANWSTFGTQTEVIPIENVGNQSSEYYGNLLDRINNEDLPKMNAYQRDEFFKTPQGTALKVEMGQVVAERRAMLLEESAKNDPMNILLEELEKEGHRSGKTPMEGVRERTAIARGEAPLMGGGRRDAPVKLEIAGSPARTPSKASKTSGYGTMTTASEAVESVASGGGSIQDPNEVPEPEED